MSDTTREEREEREVVEPSVASVATSDGVEAAPSVDATDVDGEEAMEDIEARLDKDLSKLTAERDEYLDALKRLQADFENYKKRMIRQQTDTLDRAAESLVVNLLPVLDAIDAAHQHGSGDAVAPVAGLLVDALAKAGLSRLDPVGQPFDPEEHEAVAHEPADETDAPADGPIVAGLMRAGYRWKGRLLRPAMVTVKG